MVALGEPQAASVTAISIAGRALRLTSEDPGLLSTLRTLLAAHRNALDEDLITTEAAVHVVPNVVERRATLLKRTRGRPSHWAWAVAPATAADLPNRVYYWAALPMLTAMLETMGLTRVHGALLTSPRTGPVALIGPSGAGKSTAAAAWIAAEGRVATDDMFFAEWTEQGRLRCHGLRRPMHLDPELVTRLPELVKLDEGTEYLPGRGKIAYEWWRYHRACVAEEGVEPAVLLISKISTATRSQLIRARPDQVIEAVGGETEDWMDSAQEMPRSAFLRRWTTIPAWWICWGDDVWDHPDRHLGVLEALLAECE